jgi:hypothetical protein
MGLWIESLENLQPLAALLSGQAELVASVSASDRATPEQKRQISDDAVKLSAMVMAQLEMYDLGKPDNDKPKG